jgi:glycosyltransferase involved in cell wall biosynthesis
MKHPGFGWLNWLARTALKLLVGPLRKWDLKAAQRPDFYIANSKHIQADIKKYYNRDSVVICPPVKLNRFAPSQTKRHGFVTVGRQVPYKHTEVIIEACNKLGLPLMVVGNGPEHKKLKSLAGPTIQFDNKASDEAVATYMAGAKAFIFAAYEDFGITPVEALASGTPVIALKAGGALDYIKEGVNGLFFEDQTVRSLIKTLQDFSEDNFDPAKIGASSQNFSTEAFQKNMRNFLETL